MHSANKLLWWRNWLQDWVVFLCNVLSQMHNRWRWCRATTLQVTLVRRHEEEEEEEEQKSQFRCFQNYFLDKKAGELSSYPCQILIQAFSLWNSSGDAPWAPGIIVIANPDIIELQSDRATPGAAQTITLRPGSQWKSCIREKPQSIRCWKRRKWRKIKCQ